MTTDPQPYQDELREINAYSDRIQQDVRNQAPPIPAYCHDFLDASGQREARLVVLLDSRGRAIEADLYYDSTLPGYTQNRMQRMAKNLLAAGYASSGPNIPFYAYDLGQQLDSDAVVNRYARDEGRGSINVLYVAAGIVALFFVVGILFAMLNVLFRSRQEAVAPTATPALVGTFNNAGGGSADAAAATAAAAAAVDPAAVMVQTNNLPASRNANPAIGVNQTVRIRDQLRSFVRSQPGSDQGEPVGFLQDGETALVVGGPVLLAGDSDTIVWWYVQLNDGTRGWTPANTSTLALLEPAQ